MNRQHDITWFLSDPNRLLKMKPFTRGGVMKPHGFEDTTVLNNTTIDTGLASLTLKPISQDTFITEYRPSLHHIILNQSIPHIKVTFNGVDMPFGMYDMTQTASFQKLIHSAHVRSLTSNPLDFTLLRYNKDETALAAFDFLKSEWRYRDMDYFLYQAINTCKQVGNCGMLFTYDTKKERFNVMNFSYEDGYQIIPNYDEFGYEIARSLVYQVESKLYIDVFDDKYRYHIEQGGEEGWIISQPETHGFSRCPLLHKRGQVAWEYAESSIEMWELMANINAIALKRFGTFALVLTGEMDADSFKRDSSTLIINLSSDTTNGKQDAKTLEFPEPQTMDKYLKTLEEKISLFSSTSFITPKDITNTGSGGNGIALAMSNDVAVATQSAIDWKRYLNEMVILFQEGLDLETNGADKYNKIRMGAKIIPWSLETNNMKITNLSMEGNYLSTKTMLERLPDAAPDEAERVISERGSLKPLSTKEVDDNSIKAKNISVNKNGLIRDNE